MIPQKKNRRWLMYALYTAALVTMFVYGYVTVYKNTYNIMNDKPITVFSFYRTDSGISVVILNTRYDLFENV